MAQRILAALTASPYQRAVDAHAAAVEAFEGLRAETTESDAARQERALQALAAGRAGLGHHARRGAAEAIVMLTGDAPPGGAVVSLSSSSPGVQVPATVTVPAGSPPAYVNVSTSEVTANTMATVTATYHDASVSSKLTLTAQQAPASVASVPPFITIGQDGANGGFSIATSQVSTQTAVTISATGAG